MDVNLVDVVWEGLKARGVFYTCFDDVVELANSLPGVKIGPAGLAGFVAIYRLGSEHWLNEPQAS